MVDYSSQSTIYNYVYINFIFFTVFILLFLHMYIGANPLYNVNWVFGDTFLAFICKLACRTSIISGCKVSLLQGTETTSVQSEQPVGTLEKLSGRDSSVVFINDISLNNSFSYRAIALTDDGATEFGEELVGNVSIEVLNSKFL